MSVDILGTSCDQCQSMVQYSFRSMETRRLIRTDSPGRPPRLSHSSWTMHNDSQRRWCMYMALGMHWTKDPLLSGLVVAELDVPTNKLLLATVIHETKHTFVYIVMYCLKCFALALVCIIFIVCKQWSIHYVCLQREMVRGKRTVRTACK